MRGFWIRLNLLVAANLIVGSICAYLAIRYVELCALGQ